MRRTSFIKDENFEYVVLPSISSISHNNGNTGGQYLSIKGTGFSPSLKNNSVSVDGNVCEVTSASSY
jgi:hypothetical protein